MDWVFEDSLSLHNAIQACMMLFKINDKLLDCSGNECAIYVSTTHMQLYFCKTVRLVNFQRYVLKSNIIKIYNIYGLLNV